MGATTEPTGGAGGGTGGAAGACLSIWATSPGVWPGVNGAGLSLAVLALIPGQPAAPADVAILITWFALTGRKDLAPPPEQ